MNSGLVYLRPFRLAYVRVTGPYDTSIEAAWTQMFAWLDKNGVSSPTGRGYGLARDNPEQVRPANCRYDACIQVGPMFEDRAQRELGLVTLPAGPYTRSRQAGGYEPIQSMMGGLYSTFGPAPALRLDERRPIVTIYLDDPRRLDARDLRADVCVPVTASKLGKETPVQVAA